MSQTDTNTNNGQNKNQNSGRGGEGRGPGDCRNNRENNSITNKYSFEGEMKDGPISKLTITEIRHRPIQYKKVIDTQPVKCADKNYQGLDDVIRNGIDLIAANFTTPYPDANLWCITHHK